MTTLLSLLLPLQPLHYPYHDYHYFYYFDYFDYFYYDNLTQYHSCTAVSNVVRHYALLLLRYNKCHCSGLLLCPCEKKHTHTHTHTGVQPEDVNEVYLGNVIAAGKTHEASTISSHH